MQRHFIQLLGAGTVALGIALAPVMSASAQTPETDDTVTEAPVTETIDAAEIEVAEEGDRDFDWGWLGLLGLTGLAGLARKPKERIVYREPEVRTTATYEPERTVTTHEPERRAPYESRY